MENLDYKELRRQKASSNHIHKIKTAKKIISSCKLTGDQEMLENVRTNNFKK